MIELSLPLNKGFDMKNKFTPIKEFEDWIANPFMLNKDNDPGSFGEYTHPYTKGAWDCYKHFTLETRVVTQEEHQEGCVQTIVNFLQQMKRLHGVQVRQDEEGCVVVYNPDTGYLKRLNEQQGKGLI
jgi:hypothetical protein